MITTFNPSTNKVKTTTFLDQGMFIYLYDMYFDRIYRFIYFYVADQALAQNITSKVFHEIWNELPNYLLEKSSIIVWLYSIVYSNLLEDTWTEGLVLKQHKELLLEFILGSDKDGLKI